MELARADGKLSNKGFVEKAPADVVKAEQEKRDKYRDMLTKVEQRLKMIAKL
jgi:valyl-tRNA synthetase